MLNFYFTNGHSCPGEILSSSHSLCKYYKAEVLTMKTDLEEENKPTYLILVYPTEKISLKHKDTKKQVNTNIVFVFRFDEEQTVVEQYD